MLPEDIIYVTTYKSCSRLRKCAEPKACLASLRKSHLQSRTSNNQAGIKIKNNKKYENAWLSYFRYQN